MGFWGHNFDSRRARRSIKGSIDAGDHLVSKVWAKILAHWIGVQGQSVLVKSSKTHPLWELLPGELLTQIKKMFLIWRPLGFGDFRKKKRLNSRGFARDFLRSGVLYRPGKSLKRRGKSSSLHSKKNFCLGVRFFCDVISGGLLGNLGPLCLALGANP